MRQETYFWLDYQQWWEVIIEKLWFSHFFIFFFSVFFFKIKAHPLVLEAKIPLWGTQFFSLLQGQHTETTTCFHSLLSKASESPIILSNMFLHCGRKLDRPEKPTQTKAKGKKRDAMHFFSHWGNNANHNSVVQYHVYLINLILLSWAGVNFCKLKIILINWFVKTKKAITFS